MRARWLAIAVSSAVLLLAGCSSSAADDAQSRADGQYLGDLDARGVPTGVTNGAPPALGHAICSDLDAGAAADAKVAQVAGLQLNHMAQFTTPQAEMIVYWAVIDLCLSHGRELQQNWRDGA